MSFTRYSHVEDRRASARRFHHDFETYSEIDLLEVGTDVYSRHGSTQVLMLAYSFDDGPIEQWVPACGDPMPREVWDAMLDDEVTKLAWNAPFEWSIWRNVLKVDTPFTSWRDPMVLAQSLAFPGKLFTAGRAMGLDEALIKQDGMRLINWFCKPRPATKRRPAGQVMWFEQKDRWQEFLEYNRVDVLAERAIWEKISPFNMPDHEWELWALDQTINQYGIPINIDMVENAIRVREKLLVPRLEEMRDLTGLENPNSRDQLLAWLQLNGYLYFDLKAGHVKRALQTELEKVPGFENQKLIRVLKLRLETSLNSLKKYDALRASAVPFDDVTGSYRIRNCAQFNGAGRTGRWAGRIYQHQNLINATGDRQFLNFVETDAGHKKIKSGPLLTAAKIVETTDAALMDTLYDQPMQVLAECVRPVVQAPPGWTLIDADLKAIENVVLGYFTGDQEILKIYEKNLDPYISFAVELFGRSYAEIEAECEAGDKTKRKIAKPPMLGCGYKLGPGEEKEDKRTGEIIATGLLGYGQRMGIYLTLDQAERAVEVWRNKYYGVTDFWWEVDAVSKRTVKTGAYHECRGIEFDMKGPFLRMLLPAGRALHYYQPKIQDRETPWGEKRPTLTYMGKDLRGQWKRQITHPGKITENMCQGIARDILAHGLRLAIDNGLLLFMHIHDQCVGLVPEEKADEALELLTWALGEVPVWCSGLPLSVEGHLSNYFVKT